MNTLRLVPPSGATLELTKDRTLLGRDATCDVTVDDKSVSRKHALIERRGDVWFIADQGSANGTFLGGQRISESGLKNGQALRLGAMAYRVEIETEAGATMLMDQQDVGALPTMMIQESAWARLPAPSSPAAGVSAPPPPGPPPPAVSSPAAPAARRAPPPPTPGSGPPAARPPLPSRVPPPGVPVVQREEIGAPLPAAVARGAKQAAEVAISDLPSAQPVVVADLIDNTDSRRASIGEAAAPGPAPAKGTSELLPSSTLYLTVAATLFIALSAYFSLSTGKTLTAVKARSSAPELLKARKEAKEYASALTLLQGGVLKNGKLRLCSKASVPLEVSWLGAVYLKSEDLPPTADRTLAELASGFKVVTYNSAFCGKDFKLVLPPGGEQEVKFSSPTLERCNWDGSAIFFALSVERPGAAGAGGLTAEGDPQPVTSWTSGPLSGAPGCVSVGQGS